MIINAAELSNNGHTATKHGFNIKHDDKHKKMQFYRKTPVGDMQQPKQHLSHLIWEF